MENAFPSQLAKLGSKLQDSGGTIQRSSETVDLCICEFAVTGLDGLG